MMWCGSACSTRFIPWTSCYETIILLALILFEIFLVWYVLLYGPAFVTVNKK